MGLEELAERLLVLKTKTFSMLAKPYISVRKDGTHFESDIPVLLEFYYVTLTPDHAPLDENDILVSTLLEFYREQGFPKVCYVSDGNNGAELGYIKEDPSVIPENALDYKSAAIAVACLHRTEKKYMLSTNETLFHKTLKEFFDELEAYVN
jgi:hypothetical protein